MAFTLTSNASARKSKSTIKIPWFLVLPILLFTLTLSPLFDSANSKTDAQVGIAVNLQCLVPFLDGGEDCKPEKQDRLE